MGMLPAAGKLGVPRADPQGCKPGPGNPGRNIADHLADPDGAVGLTLRMSRKIASARRAPWLGAGTQGGTGLTAD